MELLTARWATTSLVWRSSVFYRPLMKLREGNGFTGVCLSTGHCVSQHASQVTWPTPTHPHPPGHPPSNIHTPWTPTSPDTYTSLHRDGHWSGRYASYWNAFSFYIQFRVVIQWVSGVRLGLVVPWFPNAYQCLSILSSHPRTIIFQYRETQSIESPTPEWISVNTCTSLLCHSWWKKRGAPNGAWAKRAHTHGHTHTHKANNSLQPH